MLIRKLARNAPILVLATAILATAQAVFAQTYSVRDLGVFTDLPGRADSRPNAINRAGTIAAANVTNGAYRAFLYGGAWTNLGTLGGTESLGAGINDSNRVVGYSRNSSGASHAFLWTPGGTNGVPSNPQMRDLGTLGGVESAAFSINASGQIAGYAQTSRDDHAFLYSGGTMTDIGSLLPNGLPNSYGFGINDAGRIAGTAYNNSFSSNHAFFFDGVNMVDLGTFGGQNSAALAINNSDVIVGYYTLSPTSEHAFRYVGGAMTDLGTLGGDYSYANAINNSNIVVGGSFTDASNAIFHACLWTANTLIDLNTRLDATGAGWTLVEARAINDAGQIAGTGTRGGATRGFLLTPLTPPQIAQPPTNLTAACGANAAFSVTAVPEPLSYRWFKGTPPSGSPVTSATNNILTLTNVTGAQAGAYYVVVTNSAGSVTSSVATLTVPDTTPPVLSSCPADRTNNTAFGLCTAVVTWTSPTALDNCDGPVLVVCTPSSGSAFSKGATTVTCRANDSSLNTNSCSFTVTVQDRQLPAMTGCLSPMTNQTAPGLCTAIVTWTSPTALDNCDGPVPVVCTPPSGSTFNKGVRTVTCRAADSSQNTNSCSFNVWVLDSQAPALAGCPGNLTNYPASGASTATVTWSNPTALDNCDGPVLVICTPSSGSTFNLGVTNVICQAQDTSLNTNTCAFTVTVVQTQAPRITEVKLDGAAIVISFTTVNAGFYSVEATETLGSGHWTNVVTNLAGTGGILTTTNAGAAVLPHRFYRVRFRAP